MKASSHFISLDFGHDYSTVACQQYDEYWEKHESNKSSIINVTGGLLQSKYLIFTHYSYYFDC